MAATPEAVVDALNALLEAEQNSIFRFMQEGSPYLGRATAEVRRPLNAMVQESYRHCAELSAMVESLGGVPRPRGLQPEEQYLAFLSLKFLLPKLVEAKKLTIRRYENTLKALDDAPGAADARGLLEQHINEHRTDLATLERATADVLAKK